MIDKILNLILPVQCMECGAYGGYVCDECARKNISIRGIHQCHVCKQSCRELTHPECEKHTFLDGVFICLDRSSLLLRLVHEFKYNYYSHIAGYLADYYIKKLEYIGAAIENPYLTIVPIHRRKKWKRGFNQMELIMKAIMVAGDYEGGRLLKRIRNTRTQVDLDRDSRMANLSDAFRYIGGNGVLDTSRRIIVLDDLMTTGTTLEECAKKLKASGFSEVYGLVLMRD